MNSQKNHTQARMRGSAQIFRAVALMLVFAIIFGFDPGSVRAVSTWNPTLIVNTESFQEIDAGDGTTGVDLRFGTSNNFLTFVNNRFQFSKSLSVLGTLSGTTLRVDQNADVFGRLSVSGAIISKSTLSGSRLVVSGAASFSGAALFRTNLGVKGALSGSSFFGAGLGDCNNSTTSKLIYNSTTGKFSCATDQTGGSTGGGANWSNTGSLQGAFDNRYVNQSGDTMTGALFIQNGSSHTPTTDSLLRVRGGLSGEFLRVNGNADIHGPLALSGSLRGDGDFTINDDRTTAANAVLTFGNSTLNQTLSFIHSAQRFEFSTSVRVLGTISGSTLRVDGNADVNGRLSLSGATLMRSIADPAAPGTSRLATFAGDLGGRTMLKGIDPAGLDYAYQPGLFQSQVMMLTAGGGTTVNGFGTTVTNDTTVSHPAADQTFGYMANFATAATLNDTAGTSSANTTFFRGSTAGANGFFFRARIGVVDTTTIRTFVGLANQTIATMVGADSPAGHFVGFQFSTNRADTNWQFVTKDGTTQSTADTTIAFTANKVYDLTFFCTKQCTSITWQIQNVTDATSATGTASANLPGTSTSLRIVNGVSALAAAARNIRMQFSYVEADR